MDADTVVRYKNDSREWIFKDNDLCRTKETTKSFKDVDQSEYESNIEIFGEITIQFNDEVHLLYDGPVQIKCSRHSQDYSFNCSNVINKSSEVTVTKSQEIIRKPKVTLNKRASKRDVYSKTTVDKHANPNQPTIPINSRSKPVKSPPVKLNKNVLKSDSLCTKSKWTASDDVCSRTSQVIIPRKTYSSDLTNKANITCVPVKNKISSLHSTNNISVEHKNVEAKGSSITKNIRATFNKLIQSNASSLQTTIDDIRIINTNLKQVSPAKDNAKENLTILVASEENTNTVKKNLIEVNNRKSKLHEKILRGRSKGSVPDQDINIINEVTINQKFGKELPKDCASTPIKNNVTVHDDVIVIEDSNVPNSEKENVEKSLVAEAILQNCSEISLTKVTGKERLSIPNKLSVHHITDSESVKIIPNEKKDTKSETSVKSNSNSNKASKLNKKTSVTIANKPNVKLPEDTILVNEHLKIHEHATTQELNEIIEIDNVENNSSPVASNNSKNAENEKGKSEISLEHVASITNSTKKIVEQNSAVKINNAKQVIEVEKSAKASKENVILSTENTTLENVSVSLNKIVDKEEIVKTVEVVKSIERSVNESPEKANESLVKSKKALKGKKRKRSGLKSLPGSPTSNTDGNKTGGQKKLTQYFTKKSNKTDDVENIVKDNAKTENVDEKIEKNKVQNCNNENIENSVSNKVIETESGSSAEKLQNNECLRNISISVLEGNQNAEQHKTSTTDIENNKSSPLSKPEECIVTLVEENLEVAQKENIPAATNEAKVIAKSKDLTQNEEVLTNVTRTKIIKGKLRSKMKSSGRRMTRSKRPSKLVSMKKSSNRKNLTGGTANNSPKSKNAADESKNKNEAVENISETENKKSPTVNKTASIKRESKPDETENIIRLETIGTEIHTFHCKKCDKIFLRKSLLIKHEKESHPLKKIEKATKRVRKIRQKYDCSKCSESFLNARALKLHKCSKQDSNVDVSEKAQEESNTERENTAEEPQAKRVCTEDTELKVEEILEVKTETDLPTENTKTKKKIDKSINKSFVCPHCNVNMLSTNDLKVHVKRVHEKVKSKICPYCSRGFTCTGDLTRHIRLHTGEKPFKCTKEGCKMAFIASGDLIKHERTHLGDQYPRNFGCDICGKSFKQRYEHDRHIRTAHTSATKQFECHLCKKQFGRKDGLMYHLRLHAGIKPYTCKTCGKQFTDSGNLKKHMNTRRHELPPKKKRNRQKKTVETDEQ